MSQGIGRPEERKKDRGTASGWGSQNTQNIYGFSSLSYVGIVCSPPKNYNSIIKGYQSQITITDIILLKNFEIL